MAKKRLPKKLTLTFTEQLRALVDGCGMTRYEICKETGIAQSQLSRFMSGERGLSTNTLDALAAHLGWEVVQRGAKRS